MGTCWKVIGWSRTSWSSRRIILKPVTLRKRRRLRLRLNLLSSTDNSSRTSSWVQNLDKIQLKEMVAQDPPLWELEESLLKENWVKEMIDREYTRIFRASWHTISRFYEKRVKPDPTARIEATMSNHKEQPLMTQTSTIWPSPPTSKI